MYIAVGGVRCLYSLLFFFAPYLTRTVRRDGAELYLIYFTDFKYSQTWQSRGIVHIIDTESTCSRTLLWLRSR